MKGLLSLQVKTLSDANYLRLDSDSKYTDEPNANSYTGPMTNMDFFRGKVYWLGWGEWYVRG